MLFESLKYTWMNGGGTAADGGRCTPIAAINNTSSNDGDDIQLLATPVIDVSFGDDGEHQQVTSI